MCEIESFCIGDSTGIAREVERLVPAEVKFTSIRFEETKNERNLPWRTGDDG